MAWSFGKGKTMLTITKPHDGKEATVGNGVMVALGVEESGLVDKLHARALELGGSDDGAPGQGVLRRLFS